jgi:insulin gene enhancer protein ISL-1
MSEESLNDSLKMNKKQKSNTKVNGSKMKTQLNYGLSGNSLLQINSNHKNMHHHSSGSSKPARIRTVLNEKQLQTLRACYGANPRPDALMKEQLVEMTGLNPRVIRVWFQNKRCKDKKKNMLGRNDQPMVLPLQYNSNPLNNFNNPNLHHHHHMVSLNNPHPSLMYDNCY